MRLVLVAVTIWLVFLGCCRGVRRSNNSPASKLLPAGEYFEDIEVLYRLDEVFQSLTEWNLRNKLARALLLVVPLSIGEEQTLNLQDCVLGEEETTALEGILGVSIQRASPSEVSSSDESNNRWVFRKIAEVGSRSVALLLQDVVIGGVEDSGNSSIEEGSAKIGAPTSTHNRDRGNSGFGAFEEKMLVKQAYDDISSGRKSRSIMTRAQRIWDLYQNEYQRFPKIKVRFFDGYRTGRRVGEECEVNLVSTLRQAVDLVDDAKSCIMDGTRKLFCLRHGAALAPVDLSSTFLRSELRPPGVNLYLIE